MQRLIAFAFVCALWPLASCGGGDGTLESCVGPYTGTFKVDVMGQGTVEGRILAYLPWPTEDGMVPLDFEFTFEPEAEIDPKPGAAIVSDTGDVAPDQGFDLVGQFDLDACEASGTFSQGEFYVNGTWRLGSGHSAY